MICLFWLGFALAYCAPLFAADEPNIFIVDLDGPVFLQTLDHKAFRLTRKAHLGRHLQVGEAVQCRPGGRLVIEFEGQPQSIPPSATWVTILWRPNAAQSAQEAKNAEAAKNYGRPGGSEKAVRSVVFSPASAAVVRPSTFRIAWNKSEVTGPLSLAIADEDGNELWRQNGIAGAAGLVESEAARDALRKYRESMATGSLTLTLDQGPGHLTEVFFSVLREAAERKLDQELKDWDPFIISFFCGAIRGLKDDYNGQQYPITTSRRRSRSRPRPPTCSR
jgi:hypothetical protein